MEQQLIRERYELSMARILKFQEEQTVTEPYRDFFTAMSRFIGLCGRVMEAVEEGIDHAMNSHNRKKGGQA